MDIKQQIIAKLDQANAALSNSPIVKGLVDGGLSLVPFLGTAITSALDTRALKLFEENSKRFAEEVRQIVSELDDAKLDKSFIESDEFVSLLTEILARNARTYEQEKVKLFAKLFVNSVTVGKSRTPYKEGFVRVIDELSTDHIRVLAIAYEKSLTAPNEAENVVRAEEIARTLDIPASRAEAYGDQMIRFGLLRDWYIGRWDYKTGHYQVTEYGRGLAEFLKTQS
jgi:hypothetical protein